MNIVGKHSCWAVSSLAGKGPPRCNPAVPLPVQQLGLHRRLASISVTAHYDQSAASSASSGREGFVLGYPQLQQGVPHLPDVDWRRYHLQVLFIDRSDMLRARLAAGLFDRIAEWNGYGRALYAWTCGLQPQQQQALGSTEPLASSPLPAPPSPAAAAAAVAGAADSAPDESAEQRWSRLTTQAGLMHKAALLGIPPKAFARPVEAFELADLDRYDVVVALDSSVRQQILEQVDPEYCEYYSDRLRLLTEYASPAALADDAVLRRGGTALLPRAMSSALGQPRLLGQLRQVVDVQRPALGESSEAAVAEWNAMVHTTMLGCAGLVHYLINAYPPDLPNYDPL